MERGRRLTDQELATAELLIQDPFALGRLSSGRPLSEQEFVILGEYHQPETADLMWCSHCQAHRHRNGFVIEVNGETRHLIGSHCGQAHYGASFSAARAGHSELRSRQSVLGRLRLILDVSDELLKATRAVMRSPALELVASKRAEFDSARGDLAFRLASAVIAGGFVEEVKVRNYAAEQRRGREGPPIYTTERRGIGPVEGEALFRGDFCRDSLLALQEALSQIARDARGGTDRLSTLKLTNLVRKVEEAWDRASEDCEKLRDAPRFFSPSNLDRLLRWAAQFNSFTAGVDRTAVVVGGKRIEPLPDLESLSFPDRDAM